MFKKYTFSFLAFLCLLSYAFAQKPVINAFYPTSGAIASTVVITGDNFDSAPANNIVYFGAVRATVTSASKTQLLVTVPKGFSCQPITVTTNKLMAISDRPFVVTFSNGVDFGMNTFGPKAEVSVNSPRQVASHDLDNDGKPDIVASTYRGFYVFPNTSSGYRSISFGPKQDFAANTDYPGSPLVVDLDGDGLAEIVVVSSSTQLSIYKNISSKGYISLATKLDISVSSDIGEVSFADIDQDGKMDLLVADMTGLFFSVLKNISSNGIIRFADRMEVKCNRSTYNIASADLDGDGKPDVAVTDTYGRLYLYQNISSGNDIAFEKPITIDGANTSVNSKIYFGDFDQDGKIDLGLVGGGYTSAISIFRNTFTSGKLSFGARQTFDIGYYCRFVTSADFDGDGKIDLAGGDTVFPGAVMVLKNKSQPGTIAFAPGVSYAKSGGSSGITSADYDLDGKPDILVSTNGNVINILRNRINEFTFDTFAPKKGGAGTLVTITGNSLSTVTAVSFGNSPAASFKIIDDKLIEAVVGEGGSGDVTVVSTEGESAIAGFTYFRQPVITNVTPKKVKPGTRVTIYGSNLSDIVAVTFGGVPAASINSYWDNSMTAVVGKGASGRVAVYNLGGASTFNSIAYDENPPVINQQLTPKRSEVGTKIDIVGEGFNADPSKNVVLFGSVPATVHSSAATKINVTIPTGGVYQPISVTNKETGLTGWAPSNFNATFNSVNRIAATDFSPRLDFQTTAGAENIYVADIDGDGRNDVLVLNPKESALLIYRNTTVSGSSTITYAEKISLNTGDLPSSIAIGDLNGDGKQDIVIANSQSNNCWVYTNQSAPGAFAFAAKTEIETGSKPVAIQIADLDLDGRPELIVANNLSSSISVFRNTTANNNPLLGFERADFKVDGKPNLLATGLIWSGYKPNIVVAYENSMAVFSNESELGEIILRASVFGIASKAKAMALADFNHDGKLDIAVYDEFSQKVTIAMNENSFTATKRLSISVGNSVANIGAADIDGDGKVDLILSYATGGAISMFRNTIVADAAETFSFAERVDVMVANNSPFLALADANGDGKTDIHLLNVATGFYGVARYNNDIPNVLPNPPKITSFSPLTAKAGETIVINGSNFSEQQIGNVVFFGTIKAAVISASKTQLSVAVPKAAGYGKIEVLNTLSGLVGASSSFFMPSANSLGKVTSSDVLKAPTIITQADLPTTITSGDLDGDGKPEIITLNSNVNSICIYPNASASNYAYQPQIVISTTAAPTQVRVADINMDGKPDLIVLNQAANSITVLINQSATNNITASSFSAFTFATSQQPNAIAIADFDGDGRPDIAVAGNSSIVNLLMNKHISGSAFTNNSIAGKMDIGNSYGANYIFAEDFDNDGKIDLLLGGNYTTLNIHKNTSSPGSPSFVRSTPPVGIGGDFNVAAIGDLNLDGKLDLILATNDSYGKAYLNVYENTSSTEITFNLLSIPNNGTINYLPDVKTVNSIQIADVDGDTKPDILAVHQGNAIAVVRNIQPLGSKEFLFAEYLNVPIGKIADLLIVDDLTTDGRPDFVILNKATKSISVHTNQPLITPAITSISPLQAEVGATLTITGSNFGNSSADNVVYFGAARAQISSATANQLVVKVPAGASFQAVAVVNLPTAQIAYSPQPFKPVFETKKSITSADFANTRTVFVQSSSTILDHNPRMVAVGDLNNNGKMDYVVSHQGDKCVYVYLDDDTRPIKLSTDVATSGVKIADLDADGYLDIIAANYNDYSLSIFRNTGSATVAFAPMVKINAGSANQIEIEDLDNDGKPEIIFSTYLFNSYGQGFGAHVGVIWNKSSPGVITDSSFGRVNNFQVGERTAAIKVADIDGDGKKDIVTANYDSNTISILRNTITNHTITANAFAPRVNFDTNRFPSSLTVADFDGDGKLDIAVNSSEGVAVFRNTATVGMINEKSLAGRVTFASLMNQQIISADVDGDGKIDLVGANTSLKSLWVLRNTAEMGTINEGSFMPAVSLEVAGEPVWIVANDLNADGLTDFAVLDNNSRLYTIVNKRTIETRPTITSFTPNNLRKGDAVTITGSSFTGVTDVRFGGYAVESFDVVSANSITAKIGNGFSGTVTVTGPKGAGTIDGFIFVPTQTGALPPVITSFSPASGAVGSSVKITGKNFSTIPNNNSVHFGSIKAVVTQATENEITAVVPLGAVHLPLSVTVNQLTASTHIPFVTTFDYTNSDLSALSFVDKAVFDNPGSAKNSLIGDFDGDGKVDVAILNSTSISFYRNVSSVGATSFNRTEITLAKVPNHFLILDVDGDGKHDIVIANSNSTLSVLKNTGSVGQISFSITDITLGHVALNLATGDLDKDGKPDLVVAAGTEKSAIVLKNTTSANHISFVIDQVLSSAYDVNVVAVGDIDGDDKPDVILDSQFSSLLAIFLNKTTSKEIIFASRFETSPLTLENHGTIFKLSVANINGDDKLDVIASYKGLAVYMLNVGTMGNPKFNVLPYGTVGRYTNHGLGDLDGDGKVDFIGTTGESYDRVYVHRNTATPENFGYASFFIPVGTNPVGVAAADFDGDGRTDFAIAEVATNKLSVYRNIKKTNSELTSFNPISGQYGDKIEIRGINLSGTTEVFFGDKPAASFKVNSSTSITAVVGEGASGEVKLNTPIGTASLAGFTHLFYAPYIQTITPRTAIVGTTITLKGSNFINLTLLSLAGVPISNYTIVSPNEITFNVEESMVSGTITITNAKGSNSTGFTRLYGPKITSINAKIASFGSLVTITGANFTNITEVTFGGQKALSYVVNSATSITATVGVGASGDVGVKNDNGEDKLAGFTFIEPPVITSFSPKVGYAGSSITITGENFGHTTSVSFGGVKVASFTIVSPTTIIAVIGAGAAGNIAVVTKAGATNTSGFVYAPVPTIASFSPEIAASGAQVTINGTGFTGATKVTFGGVESISFTVVSDTKITANAWNVESGEVEVTAPGGVAKRSGFKVLPRPTIVAQGNTTLPAGSKVLLTASQPTGYDYQWYRDSVPITGATSSSYEAMQSGSYSLMIISGLQMSLSNAIVVDIQFTLPANNFTIKATSETCRTSNNGSIAITAVKNLNYRVNVIGNNRNMSYNFTSSYQVNNLSAGVYTVCIYVTDQPNYSQCYSISVTEPKDLSVYAVVNPGGSTLTLQLNGAERYYVTLNDQLFQTTASSIDLKLKDGLNKVDVKTDKDCQGVFEKIFNQLTEVSAFPNPFDQKLTVILPSSSQKNADIEIVSLTGKTILKGTYPVKEGVIELNLENLSTGMYLLSVKYINEKKAVLKIVKR